MRRNPFEELEELLDRLSKQVEKGMIGSEGLPVPGSVPADVVDTGDSYTVTVELPGYETDDIDLTFADGTLHLEASRTETDFEEGRYLRRERTQSTASRRIRLPEPVEEDAVSAGYDDGLLTVRLPKVSAGDESKQIDIE